MIIQSIRKEKQGAYYEGNDVIPNHIPGVVRYILWKMDDIFSWGVRRKVAGCGNYYMARNDWKPDGDGRSTCIICHPLIRQGIWWRYEGMVLRDCRLGFGR
jgi:hypothetical protein